MALVHVYILEAHPIDAWIAPQNEEKQICYRQPKSLEERIKVAQNFVDGMQVEGRIVVDDIDDKCDTLYEARPERLYVVQGGKIVWRSGLGPFQYSPSTLRAFLEEHF